VNQMEEDWLRSGGGVCLEIRWRRINSRQMMEDEIRITTGFLVKDDDSVFFVWRWWLAEVEIDMFY
jgi:hypothetical protein